ncbi:tigger transposable element-derived protein 4-like [Papilio machaon]|uniref:tigger transposable element-derived protein 4-like n=1 Tax=Papilio machaon TaxID=76193 RepID=UPI001E6655FE|nr:tigger transposable element-derived protein 4-like [Papilio machaon]
MSFWSSKNSDTAENSQGFPKKPYTKIDLMGKLHIIHALDNGQPKTDIARDYGVHPQTITYIYKQKDALIKKYSQKFNLLNEVRCINLNQTLLDWITSEVQEGKTIKEEHLREKAEEIINTISEDFSCIDDWLLDFRRRNNVIKFSSCIECSGEAKEEWDKFVTDKDINNIYIGGCVGLHHSFDFDKYANQESADKHVCLLFIVCCSGVDKQELLVVGDETVEEHSVRSLPLQYYQIHKSCLTHQIIENYLTKWDVDLQAQNRKVTLVLDIPENLPINVNLINIKIEQLINMEFITKNVAMVAKSFKFHYRRIQMTKKILFNKDSSNLKIIDYFNIMSAAWSSVASEYILRLFFPLENGCLYIKTGDAMDSNHSLLQWCKLHNIPGDLEKYSELLDSYIECDNNLQIIDTNSSNDIAFNVNDALLENDVSPSSGIQAYQAIKRLINYLQSQSAEKSIVKCAKTLEDHLEIGALQEMQNVLAANNTME